MAQFTRIGIRAAAVALSCMILMLSARMAGSTAAVSQDSKPRIASAPSFMVVSIDSERTVGPPKVEGRLESVTLSVPATAVIKVDGNGTVLEAMTNTGLPPRPDDDLWLMFPDGSMQPAPDQIADRAWVGDFSEPGVYAAQDR